MMKKLTPIFILVSLLIMGCQSEPNCCVDWTATGKTMTEKKEGIWNQYYLNDTLWFEFKDVPTNNGDKECYLINYDRCGRKASEGLAIYYEHPIADYMQKGEWKTYPCE